jgi:hypothetical protein
MEAMLKNLLRTVHRQTSIIEEQEIQSTIFFKKDLTYLSQALLVLVLKSHRN